MPDPGSGPGQALIRHPVKLILDSGFRRNDDFDIYCCRSNITPAIEHVNFVMQHKQPWDV